MDKSQIRRAKIHFLSAAVLAHGGGPGSNSSAALAADGVRAARTNVCGHQRIYSVEARGGAARSPVWRCMLCGKSECVAHQLCAQRFCRTIGLRHFSAFIVGHTEV